MATPQSGIFALGTRTHYHLEFVLDPFASDEAVLGALAGLQAPRVTAGGLNIVVGFGSALARRLLADEVPPSLQGFETIRGLDGKVAPATQHDLWVWMHGTGDDVVLDVARAVAAALAPVAKVAVDQPCFTYKDSRDLTGFIDGTANPPPEEAAEVAIVPDGERGAGGSFAITQRWVHDLAAFHALPVSEQELVFGRTKADSLELGDSTKPPNAHIARAEIERDGEEVSLFRRSTPYGTVGEHGLYFVAFSAQLDRFDLILRNMFAGADGRRDRLTDFSRPVTGSYWFVPSYETLDLLIDRDED